MRTTYSTIRSFLFLSLILLTTGIVQTSCGKKDYPCPGLGMNNEADFSLFGEDGKLKDDKSRKKRINKNTGMVNKKNPKRLKQPRKTHL